MLWVLVRSSSMRYRFFFILQKKHMLWVLIRSASVWHNFSCYILYNKHTLSVLIRNASVKHKKVFLVTPQKANAVSTHLKKHLWICKAYFFCFFFVFVFFFVVTSQEAFAVGTHWKCHCEAQFFFCYSTKSICCRYSLEASLWCTIFTVIPQKGYAEGTH